MSRPQLNPNQQKDIVAYVRAGGFPHVAAEAAGVSAEVFRAWMARGEADGARGASRDFAQAVRQAHAQARLGAEVVVRTEKPLDWLRAGPGRETADRPGWTGNVRPHSGRDAARSALADPQVQALLKAMLGALDAYPDARTTLAGWVEKEGAHCRPFVS